MASDQQILQQLPEMGRATDTVLAHMTLGEVVIPRQFMEDPETADAIQAIFEAYGVNMAEFTVGDPANKINPETGYPEFFFKKIFKAIKKVVKKVAPIALPILGTMIPGVGPVLGGAIGGALGGAASGKGLKGVLTGGALGAAGGGLSSALKGGLSIPGLGSGAGASLATTTGNAALQGPTQGTGLLGALTRGASSAGGGLSSLTGSGGNSMLSSALKIGGSLYGNAQDDKANKKILDELQQGNQLADQKLQQGSALYNPYSQSGLAANEKLSQSLAAGFQPGDLTQDPGYQFRLQEGNQALQRQMAASGLGQSGAAIKAALEYNQGLADQTYNDAYNRWNNDNQQLAQQAGVGFDSATAQSGALDSRATLDQLNAQSRAAALSRLQENKNKRFSDLFGSLFNSQNQSA